MCRYCNDDQNDEVHTDGLPLPSAAVSGSLDDMKNYLINGYWSDNSFRAHQFNPGSSGNITVNLTGLTSNGKQLARWAMEAWESVANLNFIETTSGGAQLTFDDNQSGAFAGADYVMGNTTYSASVNVGTGWLNSYGTQIDTYSFQTYIHEIGHALGLGHQGDYNGSATYGVHNDFIEDSWQLSLMSYFSQNENTNTSASYAFTMTPMMVDILAIQEMYGAPQGDGGQAGNTVYGKNSNAGGYLEQLFDAMVADVSTSVYRGNTVAITLYDRGGHDRIDLSFSSDNNMLNLNSGSFSDILGRNGNLAIMQDTVVEDAFLGAGQDTVIGNHADNAIYGNAGNDDLHGGDGNDRLVGGAGKDNLNGDNGDDTLKSKGGDDTMFGGSGNDRLIGDDSGNETMFGGTGSDTLMGLDGQDTLNGGAGDDFIYGGMGNDIILGEDGSDRMRGNRGNDQMDAGSGDDFVYGGGGDDDLFGGAGRDYLLGENGIDTLAGGDGSDNLTGGTGADTFIFASSDTGYDKIIDFENGTDLIDFSDFAFVNFADLAALFIQKISGVKIDYGTGAVFVADTVISDLDATDFIV